MGDVEVATDDLRALSDTLGLAAPGPPDIPTSSRRRSTSSWATGRGASSMATPRPAVNRPRVDYVVPTSDSSVLLLAFSTTTWQIEDELVALFDAIASTLHQSRSARPAS